MTLVIQELYIYIKYEKKFFIRPRFPIHSIEKISSYVQGQREVLLYSFRIKTYRIML